MFEITAQVDTRLLNDVIYALEAMGEDRLPSTAKAVQDATYAIQQAWIDNSKGAFKRKSGAYIAAIESGAQYPYAGDIFRGAVVNTAPHASAIEYGTRAWDMKKMLHTSSKARRSKKGKLYMIIPFRHGTPGSVSLPAMPKAVYVGARKLTTSRLTGTKQVDNQFGNPITKGKFKFGTRLNSNVGIRTKTLSNQQARQAGVKPGYHYTRKASPDKGTVKFPRHSSAGGSQYMTFRIMHEDSKGWIHPGTQPYHLAQRTAAQMTPHVVNMINSGFNDDLRMLMPGAK